MQKKLLSIAIAGALAVPGAAMADVTSAGSDITIYGKFHASWDYVDNGAGGTNDDSDDTTAAFRNSRLGFKGSEDLGNGLKGIWQIETFINTGRADTAASHDVTLRNTYIGLQGDSWGKVFFGKHDTPYKMATAKLDLFSDTIADYNNIIGAHITDNTAGQVAVTSNFNERENQLVAYATPNFNGFQGAVARESIQNDEGTGDELEGWSAMALYDQGPFFGSLSYETYSGAGNHSATATDEIDAWKLGLGYAFGNSKIGFVYEDIEHDAANSVSSRDAYWASFAHKFGANEVKLAYGMADESDVANADDGADNWSIGIDHNFSKRTKVYAIYTQMDNDLNANYGLYAAGKGNSTGGNANTDFYSGGNNAAGNPEGKEINAFSVGIIHNF